MKDKFIWFNNMYLRSLYEKVKNAKNSLIFAETEVKSEFKLFAELCNHIKFSKSAEYFDAVSQMTEARELLSKSCYFCSAESLSAVKESLEESFSCFKKLAICEEEEQYSVLSEFMLNIFGVYKKIFLIDEELINSRLIQNDVVSCLLNLGIKKAKDGTLECVSIFNPMVLSNLMFASKKFAYLHSEEEACNIPLFYYFVFSLKTLRLLVDVNFIDYNGQAVYRIAEVEGMDKQSLSFPLRKLDETSHYEEIDISRLAEKIYYAVVDRFNRITGVLPQYTSCLISYYKSEGFDKKINLLKHCLESYLSERFANKKPKFEIIFHMDFYSEEYSDVSTDKSADKHVINIYFISGQDFFEELNNDKYDVTFVLDSMFLYGPFYSKQKNDLSIFSSVLTKNMRENFYDSRSLLLYKNRTNAKSLYDRLSSMLIKPVRFNTELKTTVSDHIIRHIYEKIQHSEKDKLVYIYISDNESFFKNKFADYRFVRSERYNGKDVKVIRLANIALNEYLDDKDKGAQIDNWNFERCFYLNAYKFIKMYLSELSVINDIFNFNPSKQFDIIDGLMNTYIRFELPERLIEHEKPVLKISFGMKKSNIGTDCIIKELRNIFSFTFKKKNNQEYQFLDFCMRKGLYYAIIGQADKYEDILIAYLLWMNPEVFSVNVVDKCENIENSVDVPKKIDDYTYIHNVVKLIETFNCAWSKNSIGEMELVYWKNFRFELLPQEAKGLLKACDSVGYGNSLLKTNLDKYIEGLNN